MKTPGYWKNKGFYARLLLPVGMLYSAATAFRFKLKQPRKVPVPVICIGNLTAGGTGKTPTAADVEEVHAAVRKVLAKKIGKANANKMKILYGGSVKPSNAKEFLSLPDVDGALIGGASLKVADFMAIAKNVCGK